MAKVFTISSVTDVTFNLPDPGKANGFQPEDDSNEREADDIDKKRRMQTPLVYCKLVVKYPMTTFLLALAGHLLMATVTGILVGAGYDLFPTNFQVMPMELRDSPARQRDLAWRHRDEYPGHITRTIKDKTVPTWSRGNVVDNLQLYYDSNGGNIFTKETLKAIETIETKVMDTRNYKEQFCQIIASGDCAKPISILRFFDGTYHALNPVFTDPGFDNITQVLYTASLLNETKIAVLFFLGVNSQLSVDRVTSDITRTLFPLGWPLEGGNTTDEMKAKVEDFLVNEMKPEVLTLQTDEVDFDIIYYSRLLFIHDVQKQALSDMLFAIGSISFIFLFMWFHTGTLWITSLAVLSIMTSFCCTNLVYRVVIGFRYFGYFHILSIFIVLGIGADDLFVFYDAWRATSFKSYPSLAHRLSHAYRKSALSMFITSLTTTVAFASSALSPLLATKSFGIFSSILVIVNYVSVIVFFPTVVIIYHLKFESCCNCCEGNRKGALKIKTPSKIIIFFRDYYFKFITHKVFRWIILLFFIGITAFFATEATNLQPSSEQLKIYKDNTNYGKANNIQLYSFPPSGEDNMVRIYMSWGLKNRNLSGCHFSDIECAGKEEFDDEFDVSTAEAQDALKTFCDTLLDFTQKEIDDYKVKVHPLTKRPEIACFTSNLEAFLNNERVPHGSNLMLPWDYKKTTEFMAERSEFFDVSHFNESFKEYLDVAISYWLYSGYNLTYTEDYHWFNDLVGEETSAFTQKLKTNPSIVYGNKLKYLGVEVNTTLNRGALGYANGLPIMERWEKFMTEQVSKMPPGLQGGFQSTRSTWHWLLVQKSLSDNAILGITVGICLAFPVLVLSTQNIIVGFLATLSICCVTVCVIGVIPLAGWSLGILVSLNLCLLVGLSVDYVVHLAEAYHMSPHRDRKGRVRDMLGDVGISVFYGACTTIGASLFMIFGEIQFFLQFGIFMCCTIGFSLLFSLGFFSTLMAIVGPNDDFGSLASLIRAIKAKCNKKNKDKNAEVNIE